MKPQTLIDAIKHISEAFPDEIILGIEFEDGSGSNFNVTFQNHRAFIQVKEGRVITKLRTNIK